MAVEKELIMTPAQRIARIRRTFDKNRSVLVEDYEYFTTPRVSTPPSKAARKSAERSGPDCRNVPLDTAN